MINFTYSYELHNFFTESSWKGKIADGWALDGIAVFQSGQPYSVIDFSGAVGSIFYGTSDGINNPIVPLSSSCTPKSARTGVSGANGGPALDAKCFTLPLLEPGDLGGAIPSNDPYETNFVSKGRRNICRQTWQRRADISIVKKAHRNDRFTLKYTLEVFTLTNTSSFDIPIDDITQNLQFDDFPMQGPPALPSCGGGSSQAGAFYSCPTVSGLGFVNKTFGSPRQIQMSLSLQF